ncbi:MAG: T9SS type A sorting domain-containing protein [bacterium]
MNTYVEIIGQHDQFGNFGTDGIFLNNPGDLLQVVCANPSDTSLVKIGPCIVSWNGRMISTQIFVLPSAPALSTLWTNGTAIPLRVIVGNSSSNTDTFFIVAPQHLGSLPTPGVIGSGGPWGVRSKRGAMIVDSMILSGSGTYAVSTSDCDSYTQGNQGYLPFVLISRGAVTVASGANLNIDGIGGIDSGHGGPGGGGGGNGLTCGMSGGSGFTGGGGNADWKTGCGDRPAGLGSGIAQDALNGAFGGQSSTTNEGGGGGTGHPFGIAGGSGGAKNWNGGAPGFGGATGGPSCCGGQQGGGGGGAFASHGADGGISQGFYSGGQQNGNGELIPISGGSGGGGGNVNNNLAGGFPYDRGASNGGGGGGAISLHAVRVDVSLLSALGGAGETSTNNGAGGGGSGGAVIVGAKVQLVILPVNVSGGSGGTGYPANAGNDGGIGGAGRVRFDAPSSQKQTKIPDSASLYEGPSTDTSQFVPRIFSLSGTGNGQPIRVFLRALNSAWALDTTILVYVAPSWNVPIILRGPDSIFLLTVAQSVPKPRTDTFQTEPSWVMSQSAANIFIAKCPHLPLAVSGPDTFCLGTITILHATRGFTAYHWSDGSGSDSLVISKGGAYWVYGENGEGCPSDTAFVNVHALAPPNVRIDSLGPLTICVGDSVKLWVRGAHDSVRWWRTDSVAHFLGSTDTVFANESGIYAAIAINIGVCSPDTTTVTVLFVSAPAPHISGASVVCGDTAITYLASARNGTRFHWTSTGGTLTNSPDSSHVTVRWDRPGHFKLAVRGTDPLVSCEGHDSLDILVSDLPIAQILPDALHSLCETNSDTLRSASRSSRYEWRDTTGKIVSTDSTLVTDIPGKYALIVTDSLGCSSLSAPATLFRQTSPLVSLSIDSVNQRAGHYANIHLSLGKTIPPLNVDTIHVLLGYNNDLLSTDSVWSECGGSVRVKQIDRQHTLVTIIFSPSFDLSDTSCIVANIRTKAMLTDTMKSAVTVDNISLSDGNGVRSLEPCSVTNTSFALDPECGDTILQEFMRGRLSFRIVTVYPNPANGNLINVVYEVPANCPANLALTDALGKLISDLTIQASAEPGPRTIQLPVNETTTKGIYFLRLSLPNESVRVTCKVSLQ